MNTNLPYRIYLDLEYCFLGMSQISGRPTEEDKCYVVQIAAILFDCINGQEISSLNLLVRPSHMPVLPSFFTDLTNITQDMVDQQGMDFKKALNELVQFSKNYPVWTYRNDWIILEQNCSYDKIDFPFQNKPFIKVSEILAKWNIDAKKYSSGTLYKAAGLTLQGHVHNALHDVRSMATAIHYFETDTKYIFQGQRLDNECGL